MRYVVVSDHELYGGASIATARLVTGLVARGHEVIWVASEPDGGIHAWRTVVPVTRTTTRVVKGLLARSPDTVRQPLQARLHAQLVGRPLRRVLAALAPDVVNFHNVHEAGWQLAVLDAVPRGTRTLWTMHDMWSMTGRCAYAYDCRRFLTGCDATCPTPDEHPALRPRFIAPAWTERVAVLGRHPDVVAVAPSTWLAREAKAGMWGAHDVACIPNGVPTDDYVPVARDVARQALGIGCDERVIAVVADNITDRRKGWAILAGALDELRDTPVRALLVGDNGARAPVPAPHVAQAFGWVGDPQLQSLVLSAANCLVHPAPVDNLPNVVMEALACGVPVVAFPIGGLPDMVRPGVTGWLADEVSPSALADTLACALRDPAAAPMAAACREAALTDYAIDRQARRYEALLTGDRTDLV